ncbi:MAG: energy-coupling factor transporter ATPase [Ktedonobacteraceae bacterium]|nr:energy-coupling factor transporter ATPase [Ktedonobacteraceae bacterium]
MNDPIVVIRHLTYIYQSERQQKVALDNVNLEIARGSCTAIIGYNGSGKTTLVQHFNGLLRPTGGSVTVDGVDVSAPQADLRALRQRVGMLFQFPEAQLFERTVYADVAFGPRRMKLGRHEVRSRVLAALETVGLPHNVYGARSPFDLSGGQRRRVALAGVLAMSPTMLVLDEPTVGLDASGRAEFYDYLRRVQEMGVTIVLVSHDMAEVADLADWIFVMFEGHLVMQGSPREVFAQSEQLRSWRLAQPPLGALLTLLRQRGLDLPTDAFTLDEVVSWLLESKRRARR